MTAQAPGSASAAGLVLRIATATLFRLVLNTARRFVYPFAPVFARGLGVRLTAVTTLIAVNQATAVLGLFFGPLSDRLGYRLMLLVGLSMLAVGMGAGGLWPFYGVILAALFLAGLGKSVFDPAVQAYVSERVAYRRRGLAIGLLEFSWAGSTLLGIPLIGLLIARLGWRAPFLVMGALGLLGIFVLGALIPRSGPQSCPSSRPVGLLAAYNSLVRQRRALGTLGFAFLVSAANDNLFVVYGAWLEKGFQLSIVALGTGTAVIGIAELAGESLTAVLADRIGLKRSVTAGLVLSSLSYALLPFLAQSLGLALTALFLVFLTFEFMIVTSLSLATELLPGSRATMMAGLFASAGIGRVVGALIGGPVWLAGGIHASALVSVAISVLGLISLRWGLWSWHRS